MGKTKDQAAQAAVAPKDEALENQDATGIQATQDTPTAPATTEDTQGATGAPEDEEAPEATVVVKAPLGLNLRCGPGYGFDVLHLLPDGVTLTVLPLPEYAQVTGFIVVRYDGEAESLTGWVNTDFVREP